ncbi:hypothetical protein C922_05342 [Plasmodium inui San Antonio 1]|uniref:Plasmodium RESA N-terminal domain-containing protein n=1 Tax=Plasmodium inui San Antonio 1 TaxID=1237626 RepID=W7AG47_9APIC|nr:hypothetical protein C922_05342 [Plasmodium inui San Antonio 1]EUD64276.1 hypothetical protein C922_05342 [Plasmodium inui San Antonio 1]
MKSSKGITPMRSRIMAQIQGRNLAELNENGCLRGASEKNVEEKYGEIDFYNIFLPSVWDREAIFTSNVKKEEINQLMNDMEEVPSQDEIRKIWKRAYALEGQEYYKLINGLFEYYEKLMGKHQVDDEPLFSIWSGVMSKCFDVLKEKQHQYSKLFNGFIIKDGMTKQQFANFLKNCNKVAAEFRESLETIAKKEFEAKIIPEGGNSDKHVEEKYGEIDFYNIFLPTIWEQEAIFTSNVKKEEITELMKDMEEVPSKDEIMKIWERAYALEGQEYYKLINGLFEYSEKLMKKHQVDDEPLFSHWSGVMSKCFDVLKEKEHQYSNLFNGFIIKDGMTKQEFANFLENCNKEAAEFKESLETIAKKEFEARIIPVGAN